VNRPYLSVVVTARNDDHGGNLLGRMQAFVNGLINQCKRHRVQTELVIVEWNPLPDRPRLAEALNWLDDDGFCEVRIIEVPLEIHQRLRHWQAMPLYQMIGKNVGIRRARGEYVLATNIDILFSDELMQFFAEKRLQPEKMYRVNRWDVMANVPVNAPVEEQLAYCQNHLIRLNAREGTIRLRPDGQRADDGHDIASGGSVRLGANWFELESAPTETFRWVDDDAELLISPEAGETVLVLDVEPGPGVTRGALALELRDNQGNRISEVRVRRRSVITFTLPDGIKGTIRVRLHPRNGGRKIGSDLRTLNFRVFRCTLENPVSPNPAAIDKRETGEAHIRTTESFAAKTGRRMKLLREIWRGNPTIQVRLPLSQKRLAKLQLRQDSDGLLFAPGALKSSLDEFLPRGLEAIWGTGWYPFEDYKGERFRWMQEHAIAVWIPPRPCPGELLLHVEPGPAVGFKPCEVEIRDQWGELIATQQVTGRSTISIPVDRVSGALITSIAVRGGGKKHRVTGDSRPLALRVFASSWSKNVRGEDLEEPTLVMLAGGIWSGHRWCAVSDRNSSKGIRAIRDAELILRVPEGPNRHLILEVAPEAGVAPLDLIIEDPRGGVLFREQIEGETKVRLNQAFQAESYYALRLRDGAQLSGSTESDEPMLSVSAVQWEPIADGLNASDAGQAAETERIILHHPPPDHAIQLHTNACGDFTLLALERWMDLRAYPELDLFSMNIDSLFCWMAHHGGAREEMLEDPMRIYHIEHGTGSGWTPEGEKKLFARIAAKGLSWMDYWEVVEMAKMMNRYDAPIIFNHDNWGFAGETLKETIPNVRVAAEKG
jgi:hypothetical protein